MTNSAAPSSYFLDQKEKSLKSLGVFFASARRILPGYVNQDEISGIMEETQEAFGRLLEELPNLGGKRNLFNSSIVASVAALAYIQVLEKRKVPSEKIHESIYAIYIDVYSSLPWFVKRALRWYEFSSMYMRKLKEFARWTQECEYPENFVVEFVPGDGTTFDFGFNCTECAVVKFYQRMHAEEHIPYVCIADFAASQAVKAGMYRTSTLSNGAAMCDFRFSKNKDSLPGLPIEALPEYQNRKTVGWPHSSPNTRYTGRSLRSHR